MLQFRALGSLGVVGGLDLHRLYLKVLGLALFGFMVWGFRLFAVTELWRPSLPKRKIFTLRLSAPPPPPPPPHTETKKKHLEQIYETVKAQKHMGSTFLCSALLPCLQSTQSSPMSPCTPWYMLDSPYGRKYLNAQVFPIEVHGLFWGGTKALKYSSSRKT